MQHWEPEVEEGERALRRDLGGADGERKLEGGGQTRRVGRGDWRGGGMGRPAFPPVPPRPPPHTHLLRVPVGGQGLASGWLIAWEWGAQGVRRWASAFLLRMRPCAPRAGSASHSTWMPASLV